MHKKMAPLLFAMVIVLQMTMMKLVLSQTSLYQSFPAYGKPDDPSEKSRIMLNQLAMVQRFLPQENDQINPSGYSSNYMFVRPLLREIQIEGKNALPALAEFFDHENYLYSVSGIGSMGLGQVSNATLGKTAKTMFYEIIYPIRHDMTYEAKIVTRIGADGQEHRRPGYNTGFIESRELTQRWLQQNANKSLEEIQREIVDYHIHEEIMIGFPDEESYQRHLVPLLNLRVNLPLFCNALSYRSYDEPQPVPPPTTNLNERGRNDFPYSSR